MALPYLAVGTPKRFDSKRFRVTADPGQVLPVPVATVVEVEREGDFFNLGDFKKVVQLPEELYLRELMAVDADDADSLGTFMADYGVIGHLEWLSLPPAVRAMSLPVASSGSVQDSIYRAVIEHCPPGQSWEHRYFRHQAEVALHVATLQNAVSTWMAVVGEESLEWLLERWHSSQQLPGSPGQALLWASQTLNAGLKPFHPVIRYETKESAAKWPATSEGGIGWGGFGATTYELLCLQLANHVAEGANYARCSNQPCGQVFVRQRGRAASRQGRTQGVMYCSSACARAQAQREWRRREKTKREKG